MNGLEGTPFIGRFEGFGGRSNDSVAGLLTSRTLDHEAGHVVWDRRVVKWNRKEIQTAEEAHATVQFLEQSVSLYRDTLGEEFILPSSFIAGNKNDNGVMKHKVFITQPYIEGWTGRDVPDEVRSSSVVRSQWNTVGSRLFNLYNTAGYINSTVEKSRQFPVTMTVGRSRLCALTATTSGELPRTQNILIDRNSWHVWMFDFGEYTSWEESMRDSYNEIKRAATLRSERNAQVKPTVVADFSYAARRSSCLTRPRNEVVSHI